MAIGIRPINDFAFKKVFGTPANKGILVSLLNAILNLPVPISDVTIENPYNPQDFENDKLSILDIRAVDPTGRIYDVEIQVSHTVGLVERLVFYGCEIYAGQLKGGQDYELLKPVFVICILEGALWRDSTKVHHAFHLTDKDSGRTLDNTLAIHTLELGRYNLRETDLGRASLLDCWLYWMIHAQEYDEEGLNRLFPYEPLRRATRAIQKISEMTEDKIMYDKSEKAIRDRQWLLKAAERERKEGRKEGRMEGLMEGLTAGEIQLIHSFQDLLGIDLTPKSELTRLTLEELQTLSGDYRARLRHRP